MKKRAGILAGFLALSLGLAGLIGTAFADNGVWTDKTNGVTSFNYKVSYHCEDSDCTNKDGHVIPKTAFSYEIAPGVAIDSTATTPAIFEGPAKGLTFSGGDSYETTTWKTTFTDCQQEENVGMTLNPSLFTHAGIYRYTITESAMTAEQQALGIHKSNEEEPLTRVIDVYVMEAAGNEGQFLVSDVVMSTISPDEAPTLDAADPTKAIYGTPTELKKLDKYEYEVPLKEVELIKHVEGNAGDKTEMFPFTVQLTAADATTAAINQYPVVITAIADENAAKCDAQNITVGSSFDAQIKHNGFIRIKVPQTVKVQVKETVNAGEGYLITSEVDGSALDADVPVEYVQDKDNLHTETEYKTQGKVGQDNMRITYTNKRDQISPTGVITRYLPFAILLGAAVVLTAASKSRKAHA